MGSTKGLRILPRKTIEDFVRVRTITPTDEEFLHEECYQIYKRYKPQARRNVLGKSEHWKQLLVNNYLRTIYCKKCAVKIQCSCSPFKASEPKARSCGHAKSES